MSRGHLGVLQSKWHLLATPIEKWDELKIQDMVISCLIMHNMMVEETLEHCDEFSVEDFDNNNDYEMDEDGNVLDEAEELVCTMEAELSHLQHILTPQFLEDYIDFWTCTHR